MLNSYLQFFLIFKWIDFVEIIFISALFYRFSLWLKKDKQKNLLTPFYLMNFALIFTNLIGMHNSYSLLLQLTPIFLMLFVLIHQHTLQKNFVRFYKSTPSTSTNNWLEELMRACFMCINNKKNVTITIPAKDNISEFLNNTFYIKSNLNYDLLNALINSSSFDNEKFIWISSKGLLEAINCKWNFQKDLLWIEENQNIEEWKQDAILFSSKIESLIFKTNHETRSFDIIVRGKIIENISPNNAINIITQFIKKIDQLKNEPIINSSVIFHQKQNDSLN